MTTPTFVHVPNKLYFLTTGKDESGKDDVFLGKYLGRGKIVQGKKILYETEMRTPSGKSGQANEWWYSFSAFGGQWVSHDDIERVITEDEYKKLYEKANPGYTVTFDGTSYSITGRASSASSASSAKKAGSKRRKSMRRNKKRRSTRRKIQTHYRNRI